MTLLLLLVLIRPPPAMPVPQQSDAPPAQTEPIEPTEPSSGDLTDLSLEDLMNVDVEVTSVSKKSQSLASAPAAIFVLTCEEIRRSGAQSIPEVLRLVPGLDVARVSSADWAISARGFNDQFANKLLVLIDGRSVYTPVFSGVWWDVQDLPLEDIERIEVIRGPGAALWGANAMNGVINIITKSAEKTQGALVTVGGGTEERAFTTLRYGAQFADQGFLRVYGKFFSHDGQKDLEHTGIEDDWWQGRAGFRGDWSPTPDDSFTLQGDTFQAREHTAFQSAVTFPPFLLTADRRAEVEGGNVLTRWTRTFSKDSDASLQVYYDEYTRTGDSGISGVDGGEEQQKVLDVQLQHRFQLNGWNEVICGLGYRGYKTHFLGTTTAFLEDDHRTDTVLSAFVQDELTLVEDCLKLTLGSKFERNDYTGSEVQPDARLAWTPVREQTVWAAASRAVRTPSLFEDDGHFLRAFIPGSFGAPDTQIQAFADGATEVERLTSYQLGYRCEPVEHVALDVATFYNVYHGLGSVEAATPFFQGGDVIVPFLFGSKLDARVYGVEVASDWTVTPDWALHAGYAFLHLNATSDASSTDTTTVDIAEGSSPNHQVQLRSLWNVTERLEFDATFFYVGALPAQDVKCYVRGDLRLGWKITPDADFSLGVQGLFHDDDREFNSHDLLVPTGVQTGAYAMLTMRF